MNITQTLSEQRLSSPTSVTIKKSGAGSGTNLENVRVPPLNQDGLVSKVRMKRNTGVPNQNSSLDVLPERNMSLGSLPIIPEKGDPSLAIYDPTKNSGMSFKGTNKQAKYTSQYEMQNNYPSNVEIDRVREIIKTSPYSKQLPDYARGDLVSISGNTNSRKLTVDLKLA